MRRPFQMIDVFGSGALSGNPLAVVADAEDLDAETMQRIARWMNLSETCFLLAPTNAEADYRVRIFTLERELPFAGHPTLGSAHAWLAFGGKPKGGNAIVQDCGAGLIPLRRGDACLSFAAPPLVRSGPVAEDDLAEALKALNLDPSEIVEAQWVDNGPGWMGLLLASADAVLRVKPAGKHARRIDLGLVGPTPAGSETAFELRAIFTDHLGTLIEDPVTGSLNASIAQWMIATGRATPPYVASQGTKLGRAGRIFIDSDAEGAVWVGGNTKTVASGEIDV